MFAVIETGGKQYKVEPNQVIDIEKLEGDVGQRIVFDQVNLLRADTETFVGTPHVHGALVEGEILNQTKGDKVTIFKMKKRKGYHKKQGHRQLLTRLKITDIHLPSAQSE